MHLTMRKLIILSLFYLVSCASVPITGRKQLVADLFITNDCIE